MTLRTIESDLAYKLIEQLDAHENELNLGGDAPVTDILFPKIIQASLQFANNPEHESISQNIPGWHLNSYRDLNEAQFNHPNLQVIEGRPYKIFEFLKLKTSTCLINFGSLGTALLSKEFLVPDIGKGLHFMQIPLFLNYALSDDLWGPKGKWPRIHDKLMDILLEKDLLAGTPKIGYYPLKKEAKKLETAGIKGTLEETCFSLTLPWSFPLSAIEKIKRGF